MTLASSPTRSDSHSDFDDYDPIVEEVSHIESFDNFRNNFISNVDTEDETEKEEEEEDYDLIDDDDSNNETEKILKNSEKSSTTLVASQIISDKFTETKAKAEIETENFENPVSTQNITDSATDQDKTPEIKQDTISEIGKETNYNNNNNKNNNNKDSVITDSTQELKIELKKTIENTEKIEITESQEDSTLEIIYPKQDQKDTTLEIKDLSISDSTLQQDSFNTKIRYQQVQKKLKPLIIKILKLKKLI
ncbi:unnamed protein product [[Candida] boidinii]|uniref:Unnamed protein product n=1 Tax=Candida boidinii TaxID=5477 RepID=A0A9W6SW47_CANBO|nr:unnamed protein product [[Candida] boidinii]